MSLITSPNPSDSPVSPHKGYIPINPYTSIRLSPSHSKDTLLLNILKSLIFLDKGTPQEIYMAMKSMEIHPPSLGDLSRHLQALQSADDESPLIYTCPYYSINSNLMYSLPNRNLKLPRMDRCTSTDSGSCSSWNSVDEDEDCLTSILPTCKETVVLHGEPLKRKSSRSSEGHVFISKSKRQRSHSLSCLSVNSEWLDFEDGDSKISCDYICSSSPLRYNPSKANLPFAKHLDSSKLKLSSCFLDASFPVWTTVLENVKVYVSWIGEFGLVNSSKQACPILRRADNDMVNGTLLLHSAGLYSEQEKSIVLSLERHRVRVSNPNSALNGVWIPLSRAISLAASHCIQDKVYPILLHDLNRLFVPCSYTSSSTSPSSSMTVADSLPTSPSNLPSMSSSLVQLLSQMSTKKGNPTSPTVKSTPPTSAALLNAISTLIRRGSLSASPKNLSQSLVSKNLSLLNFHSPISPPTSLRSSSSSITNSRLSIDTKQGFEQDEITVIKKIRKRM